MHFRALELTYLDIFHNVLPMKFKEFFACNCWLQCINSCTLNVLLVLVSPTWKLYSSFYRNQRLNYVCKIFFSDMDVLLYRYKRFSPFSARFSKLWVNFEYSPGKEIQPFMLTLVLNRLARLGFRKQNRPILSERNVGTERMTIFERLLCLNVYLISFLWHVMT